LQLVEVVVIVIIIIIIIKGRVSFKPRTTEPVPTGSEAVWPSELGRASIREKSVLSLLGINPASFFF
jgi:hypothetical protein